MPIHRRSAPRVILTLAGAALLLVPRPAIAQRGHAAKAERWTAGEKGRIARALRDSLQRVLDHAVADSAFPGAIAVIGTHEGPLVTVSAGHLDWAPSRAPDMHTLWDLASLTKVVGMTSAVMQLVERGTIDLDAPVQRYLAEWRGRDKASVTVRHLLTHQSGLPPFKQYYKNGVSPESTLALFLATPLDTLPGTRMVYSDIGAILLGKIVERASGESFDRYLERHVFRPLRMTETGFRPAPALRPRIAPTERDPWRGRLLRGEVHDENAFALGGVSGHAGLFSSAHDLDRLARAYLNGGTLDGARFARAETIRQFTTVADSSLSSRALGWDTPSENSSAGRFMRRPAFGHTGFTGTSLWIAPQHDLYVMLLTNRVNPTREHSKIGPVRVRVADLAMRALAPEAASTSLTSRP